MSNLQQTERARKVEIEAVVAADRRRIDWAEIQRRYGYSADVMVHVQGFAGQLTRENLSRIPVAEPLPARIRAHARLPRVQAVRIRVRAPRLAGARRARVRRAVRTSTRAGPSDPPPEPPRLGPASFADLIADHFNKWFAGYFDRAFALADRAVELLDAERVAAGLVAP